MCVVQNYISTNRHYRTFSGRVRVYLCKKIFLIMKKPDTLKGLRVSEAAVAKILWNAIDAGADAKTMRAICDYLSDPGAAPATEVYAPAYEEAVAETDRAARRSAAARAAAARRRERRANPQGGAALTEPDGAVRACAVTAEARERRDARECGASVGPMQSRGPRSGLPGGRRPW